MKSWLAKVISLSSLTLMAACNSLTMPPESANLNSRYHDLQPALSGDSRWLAFVTNRNGHSEIVVYDLQKQRFIELPGLNSKGAIAESPSFSLTGRYLVYTTTQQGKPQIALYDRAIKRPEILSKGYRSWLRNPQISSNGRYIVFETSRRGQWDVEVLDRGPNVELDLADGTPVVN